MQLQMLQLVNQARAAGANCGTSGTFGPTTPLTLNAQLNNAAQAHSQDQANTNTMSHTGSDGSDPGQRITAAGYNWQDWGENVAYGYADVTSVMQAWMNSPGHCANIMDPVFTNIGVGEAAATNGTLYWTQDFGKPE